MIILIKKLTRQELIDALPLVWKVFCEYEAINYPEKGKKAFYESIYSKEYIDMLEPYGAYVNEKLVGIIATRNEGKHIALFFVDGQYHRQGIGRELFDYMLQNNTNDIITVNSSVFAKDIYKRLGFVQIEEMKEDDGIRYIPMEYKNSEK